MDIPTKPRHREVVRQMKTPVEWWDKLKDTIRLQEMLHREKVPTEIRIKGVKIILQIKTQHFTEKDRPRIHKIHKLLGVDFVKQYTHANRVKYFANKDGVILYMNTNIPAAPNCPLVTEKRISKRTYYNCKDI